MKNPAKVLIVGINGYGDYYLKTFLEETDCDEAVLVGVVDPHAERSKYYNAFNEFGIPVFARMNDFYLSGGKADLAVISSPPHFHSSQSILALHNGSNVLCEVPLCSQLSELDKIIGERNKSGKFIMIGYQWAYSEGIQSLKKDIIGGRYGNPLRMKSLCLWPRNYGYFQRNEWAYRKIDQSGNIIRDNLFNDLMSHFIHNMLFLLGDVPETAAVIKSLRAHLYRAYPVETYDTGMFNGYTESGAELLFLGSHASEKNTGPCFRIEFTKGFVELKPGADRIVGKTLDKDEIFYPSPDSDHQFKKLFLAINRVRQNTGFMCTPEAAMPHSLLVDEAERQSGTVRIIPEKLLVKDDDRIYIKGLDNYFLSAYLNFRMPSELSDLEAGW
jgi:predicted dehydrogenase